MAKIYENVRLMPDKLVGRVDSRDGRIYATEDGTDEFIGQVDYAEGEVYDDYDNLIGWVEENGEIFVYYEGDDEEDDDEERIGRIDNQGRLYLFTHSGEENVGSVTEMTNPVEGAAGLLFFFADDE